MTNSSEHITIGLTACGNYPFYHNWFAQLPGVRLIKLDPAEGNLDAISECDGIVLTGGQDIHPRYYGQSPADIPKATGIDESRDAFEWKVLKMVSSSRLPLLGICRGLQITNVFFGGTLITDIPSAGKENHSKFEEGRDRYHSVNVKPGSSLARIAGRLEGEINSAHHQAADRIGRGLVASAISPDGIVEALEWEDASGKPYLNLVQWHPERMTPRDDPFSLGIRTDFLLAVRGKKTGAENQTS